MVSTWHGKQLNCHNEKALSSKARSVPTWPQHKYHRIQLPPIATGKLNKFHKPGILIETCNCNTCITSIYVQMHIRAGCPLLFIYHRDAILGGQTLSTILSTHHRQLYLVFFKYKSTPPLSKTTILPYVLQ